MKMADKLNIKRITCEKKYKPYFISEPYGHPFELTEKDKFRKLGSNDKRTNSVCGVEYKDGTILQQDAEINYIIKSPEEFKFDAVIVEREKEGLVGRLRKDFR